MFIEPCDVLFYGVPLTSSPAQSPFLGWLGTFLWYSIFKQIIYKNKRTKNPICSLMVCPSGLFQKATFMHVQIMPLFNLMPLQPTWLEMETLSQWKKEGQNIPVSQSGPELILP